MKKTVPNIYLENIEDNPYAMLFLKELYLYFFKQHNYNWFNLEQTPYWYHNQKLFDLYNKGEERRGKWHGFANVIRSLISLGWMEEGIENENYLGKKIHCLPKGLDDIGPVESLTTLI